MIHFKSTNTTKFKAILIGTSLLTLGWGETRIKTSTSNTLLKSRVAMLEGLFLRILSLKDSKLYPLVINSTRVATKILRFF
jgi:hypothetical protein